MTVKFTNNANSTLASGINSSVTSMTLADASSFPSLSGANDYCYLTLQESGGTTREIVKATARSSNTFTIVRGQDNTSAATWSSGILVELRITSALLQDVIDGLGSGSMMDTDIFTGDGSDTTFTLSRQPDNENNLLIFIDGVFQAHNAYSVSGTTLTLSAAPANGRVITAYHMATTVGGSNLIKATMTGDNSDTTLDVGSQIIHENNVQVYFDGVYQSKGNYSVSGSVITFSTAPPTGVAVEAILNTATNISTAAQVSDADNDTLIQVEESADEDTIRMDVAGTEVLTLTNSSMTLKGTTPTLTIGDAGAEDTKIVFDGNAKDFYVGLDDSADKLVIGEGSTVGTNNILTITDDTVTIGDGAAVDTSIVFDGNAQDYYIGLDDSADDLVIGLGSAVGTTPAIVIDENLNVGVGVTPTAPLHVDGAQAYASSATNLSTTVSKAAFRMQGSSNASTSLFMGALTNDAQMYVQSSNGAGDAADDIILNPFGGSVGIGVGNASPDRIFHAKKSDSGGTVAKFENSAGTVYIELNTNNQAGGDAGYLSYDSNKKLGLWTDDTQQVTIDTNGKVGIGITSPLMKAHIKGATGDVPSSDSNPPANGIAIFDSGGGYALVIGTDDSNTGSAWIQSQSANVSSSNYDLLLNPNGGSVGIGTTTNPTGLPLHLKVSSGDNKLQMQTANKNAYVMELEDSTGNLKLGTNTNAGVFRIADDGVVLLNYNGGSLNSGYSPEDSQMRPLQMQSATPGIQFKGTGSSQYAQAGTIYFGSAYGSDNDKHGTLYVHEEAFHIKANDRVAYLGTGASAVWAYSSDERLKKDITDLDFGLSKLKELKPRRFKWKRDDSSDMGFIAQEVKVVLPEVVAGTGEDFEDSDDMILKDAKTLRLANDKLVPILVKAVQELSTEIESLKAEVKALKEA